MRRPVALSVCKVGTNPETGTCISCTSGYGHGPMLSIYDRRKGDYVTAGGERCTARWAMTGTDHLEGEICARLATEEAADLLLCTHHYKKLLQWTIELEASGHAAALKRRRELHAEQLRLDRERIRAQHDAWSEFSLVYYVQRQSDDLIKIGFTGSPYGRFGALKTKYRALQMLASHGGALREEQALHQKFDAFLAEGREWFRPEARLLRHILRVRQTHEVTNRSRLPIATIEEIETMIRDTRNRGAKAAALALCVHHDSRCGGQ